MGELERTPSDLTAPAIENIQETQRPLMWHWIMQQVFSSQEKLWLYNRHLLIGEVILEVLVS